MPPPPPHKSVAFSRVCSKIFFFPIEINTGVIFWNDFVGRLIAFWGGLVVKKLLRGRFITDVRKRNFSFFAIKRGKTRGKNFPDQIINLERRTKVFFICIVDIYIYIFFSFSFWFSRRFDSTFFCMCVFRREIQIFFCIVFRLYTFEMIASAIERTIEKIVILRIQKTNNNKSNELSFVDLLWTFENV